MPIVIAIAIAARWLLKYTITKSLLFMGLGYVTYLGIDVLFEEIEAAIFGAFTGIATDALNLLLLCGVDVYLTLTMSAFTTFLTIKGISAGVSTALRFVSR